MKKLQYVPQQVIDDLLTKLGRGAQNTLAKQFEVTRQAVHITIGENDV